jgi:hypothetical protein
MEAEQLQNLLTGICMRQRMEMYIVIAEVPGHRLIIQNTILLLLHSHLQQKAMVPILIPSPADQRLPVKCRVLQATGRGETPVQVPGEVVDLAEAVAVAAGEVEGVVLEEEVEEGNIFKIENALQCIQNKC